MESITYYTQLSIGIESIHINAQRLGYQSEIVTLNPYSSYLGVRLSQKKDEIVEAYMRWVKVNEINIEGSEAFFLEQLQVLPISGFVVTFHSMWIKTIVNFLKLLLENYNGCIFTDKAEMPFTIEDIENILQFDWS